MTNTEEGGLRFVDESKHTDAPTKPFVADDGGPAFPRAGTIWTDLEGRQYGVVPEPGMSLRDYFAATMDRDEFGEIAFKHLSRNAAELLVGEPYPKEPQRGENFEARHQIAKAKFGLKLRAAIRFMWADAMLAARKDGE